MSIHRTSEMISLNIYYHCSEDNIKWLNLKADIKAFLSSKMFSYKNISYLTVHISIYNEG